MAKSAPMNTPPQAAAVVGAGPIPAAVARRTGLVATVDQMLTGDATRGRLSPGERILALLLNLRTEREPWYPVDDAFRLTDPALLLGAGITGDDLGMTRDEIAVRAELQRQSCFVLITILPADRSDAAALLREDPGPNQRGATLSLPEGPHVRRRDLPTEVRTPSGVGVRHAALALAVQRGGAAGAGASGAAAHVQAGEPGAPHRLRDPEACRGIQVFWPDRDHRAAAFPSHYRPALRVILAALNLPETIFTAVPARAAPP